MKTKKTIFTALLFVCWQNMSAFTVSSNTIVTIGTQTQIKIQDFDLQNNGTLIGDTASLLIISNSSPTKITGNNIFLASLKIIGDVTSEAPILSINEDLIMLSGVMNIDENQLIINGDLLGENENTYITASTGTITTERLLAYLPAGREVSALGLSFTPISDMYDIQITRSHYPVMRTSRTGITQSANRVYDFCTPINIADVFKQILPHEVKNMQRTELFVENSEGWQRVKNKNELFLSVSRISIFTPDDLFFPKIITPNEATNNIFEILGLCEFSNSRLIIMNRRGQILYDLYPYSNDFTGQSLSDGTYYYVFSEERAGPPIKKSFFEIIR